MSDICVNCETPLDEPDESEEVQCDFCKCFYNRLALCRFCYYKPYPLRACPKCMKHNDYAIEHSTSFEEVK